MRADRDYRHLWNWYGGHLRINVRDYIGLLDMSLWVRLETALQGRIMNRLPFVR